MRLAGVQVGDTVEANVLGRCFVAKVTEKRRGRLAVEPLTPNCTYTILRARQVLRVVDRVPGEAASHSPLAGLAGHIFQGRLL